MIRLTSINGKAIVINCEMIEKIEEVPETVITLNNGHKYIAVESTEEIIELVKEYKRSIFINSYKTDSNSEMEAAENERK